MEVYELKKEQLKLAPKVILRDGFGRIKTVGGAECVQIGGKLLACAVVCEFPSLKLIEKKTFLLHNPLPYMPGFISYREMPALIEAFNKLEQEPDVLIISGHGRAHQRKFGIASHLGLALNIPTIGVAPKMLCGKIENGKIILDGEVVGFEIKTNEHANPIYASPGHLVSPGSVLKIILQTICHPHKMPEPLHIAHKVAKKKAKQII